VAWFCSINATFKVSRVTKTITKFHWALSKLLATLVGTIIPLWDDPGSVEDTCKELQRIVLRSYSLSEHQKIVKWLDHLGQGAHKPSVLMDQLNTLQPSSIVEVQKILFLRRMPAYIRDMINVKDFQDLPALTDQCDEIWESRSQDLAAIAAAAVIQADAATATVSTTLASAPAPRSAGTAAQTRKTSWPAVVARNASAGPTHPC
jgi:hypothetical protein